MLTRIVLCRLHPRFCAIKPFCPAQDASDIGTLGVATFSWWESGKLLVEQASVDWCTKLHSGPTGAGRQVQRCIQLNAVLQAVRLTAMQECRTSVLLPLELRLAHLVPVQVHAWTLVQVPNRLLPDCGSLPVRPLLALVLVPPRAFAPLPSLLWAAL